MHYKTPDNSVHFLDDDYFVHLLPAGSIAITDEEAEALKPVPPEPTVQDKLAQLDADNTLTQRNLRETVMLMAEAFKTVTNGAVDLSTIPGVAKVYAVEAEAALLREQL
jgi:hypothetical protein